MAKNKFDFMAVATQVGLATVAGGAAGLVADNLLPQMHKGWQGLAMLGLGSLAVGGSVALKQPMIAHAGLGMCGAGGDRMQGFWMGGGSGKKTEGEGGGTAGIGEANYVVVDSEVEDYPTQGAYDNDGKELRDTDPMS